MSADSRKPYPAQTVATPAELRLPSLPAIRAFEAALRLGSFERASEELALSASAVGKRVSTLEAQLGVKLLARAPGGLAPTVAGLEYVEQIRTALGLLSSVKLHRRAPTRRQRLQVCSPPTFAREVLVPHLPALLEALPELELDLALSVPYLGLRPPGVDLEIIAGPRDQAPGVTLPQRGLLAVCSAAYARSLRLDRPADLLGALLIRCPLEPWSRWFAAAGIEAKEPVQGSQFYDLGLALEAAIAGLGVTLTHSAMARRGLARGELVALFGEVQVTPHTGYWIAQHAGEEKAAAAEAFSVWLQGLCASL